MILLVEDNENDQLLMLRALRSQNIDEQVTVVTDGAQALEFLFGEGRFAERAEASPPTLILLDLKIPKISGLEVLRRIRANERLRLIPIVVMTSSAEELDIAAAYEGGCSSYIRKPIDYKRFTDAVRTIGTYWLCLNQRPPGR